MSATGRGAERVASDYYPTPFWCVRRLLEAVQLPGGAWLEPSAGDGAIIRAVREVRSDVIEWCAVEMREEAMPGLRALTPWADHADFLAWAPDAQKDGFEFNVAILNPPFVHAEQFIRHCLGIADWVVALERLNFLEGEARNGWLKQQAPDVYVLPNRPSFTGEGTDSIAYAWFLWPAGQHNRTSGRIEVLPSTPPEQRRVAKVVIPDISGKTQCSLL